MAEPSDNSTPSLDLHPQDSLRDSSVIIAELCEEFGRRRQNGDAVSVSEFAAEYPEVSTALQQALTAMELLGSFQPTPRRFDTTAMPTSIAGCEVVREIGRGGMGIVYEARHPTVSRRLAIKLLNNRPGLKNAFRERFRREAEAASRLTHPSIVPFIDCGEHDGTPFISMLFVEGESLDHLLERHWENRPCESANAGDKLVGKDFRAIAQIGAHTASALAHAHQQNTIHRDIKPANLILGTGNKLWVADFGLAKLRDQDDGLSRTGDMIGTPRYMAPEQVRGVSDERSDIYSLGVTLWELATGCRAWDIAGGGELMAAKSAMQLPGVRETNPDVPLSLARIIDKCCQSKPRNRFQTAAQLEAALFSFANADANQAPDVSSSRAALIMTCLLAVMLLVAVLTVGYKKAVAPQPAIARASTLAAVPITYADQVTEISMIEGTVAVPDLRLTVSNPEGQPYRWQLSKTKDYRHFLSQKIAGTLCFAKPPLFDLPRDENADNVYELEFESTQASRPRVMILVETETGLELLDPVSKIRTQTLLPGNLFAAGSSDGTQFLHVHKANDGSVSFFESAILGGVSDSVLLSSKCLLSPFVVDIAATQSDELIALEKSQHGFELRRLLRNSDNQLYPAGTAQKLHFVKNPVGISLLSDNDLLVLDRSTDGASLELFEVAITADGVVSYEELPTGWACDYRIRGMVSWLDNTPFSSLDFGQGPERRSVRITVESAAAK